MLSTFWRNASDAAEASGNLGALGFIGPSSRMTRFTMLRAGLPVNILVSAVDAHNFGLELTHKLCHFTIEWQACTNRGHISDVNAEFGVIASKKCQAKLGRAPGPSTGMCGKKSSH